MSHPVIRVEGLGKEYVIGARESGRETFREMLTSSFAVPFRRLRRLSGEAPPEERIWALKDVSFEIAEGEVVGIIGRNGAGKSTLLKILSRITDPTEGCVEVRGRVASLLEIGTGFHPELTGRENIYLNGAILGMGRAEIDRKFDQIVDFADVETFLDTPVKRYSSGMAVRLAFAVAAHLDPEILVIDEVLAVGDAEFQRKCLGKMRDVSGEGRTLLFVSHNMQAIQSLCSRSLFLDAGRLAMSGPTEEVVPKYLNLSAAPQLVSWEQPGGIGDNVVRLLSLRAFSENLSISGSMFPSRSNIIVEMQMDLTRQTNGLCVGFDLLDRDGSVVLRSYDTDSPADTFRPLGPGKHCLKCTIPAGLLNGGFYNIAPRVGIHNNYWILNGASLIGFQVLLDHGKSTYWHSLDETKRPGTIAPLLNWSKSE